MCLMPLSRTPKNGSDDKFQVMCILLHLKIKKEKLGWSPQLGLPATFLVSAPKKALNPEPTGALANRGCGSPSLKPNAIQLVKTGAPATHGSFHGFSRRRSQTLALGKGAATLHLCRGGQAACPQRRCLSLHTPTRLEGRYLMRRCP